RELRRGLYPQHHAARRRARLEPAVARRRADVRPPAQVGGCAEAGREWARATRAHLRGLGSAPCIRAGDQDGNPPSHPPPCIRWERSMTPEERQLVDGLFARIRANPPAERDPEAERMIRDMIARDPNAAYAMVQLTLVQEHALRLADERIRQLEQAAPPPSSGR